MSLYGQWKYEMSHGAMTMQTIQTLREDGTYETHMIYPMHGGQQHIYHFGKIDVADETLKLNFERGETELLGCSDEKDNFERRAFTDAEVAEATSLLAQLIPYSVDGDKLTTTVQSPMGEMKVIYTRV